MHVFVSGATGFVGFHTVLALLEAGHSVRFGVRNQRKMEALYGPLGIDTSDHALGEITDREAIEAALEGCDGVVHTAAMVSLDASRAEEIYQTNVRGTELVIGGAIERGMKSIIHVSSVAALYHKHLSVLDESTPLAAQKSAYGRSKADAERFVRRKIDEGANVAISYPASVLGPMDPAMSEGNQGLAIFFNQTFIRTTSGMQIIDVRDLAEAHVRLLEGEKGGRYLVAGHFRSWDELGVLLDKVTGRTLRKVSVPAWVLGAVGQVIDFPYSPVRLVVLMLPPDASIEHVKLVRDTAGIAYFISLVTLAVFVIVQRARQWPTRLGKFNVWINLPTFDPTAGGDVVERLERDARFNIALGFILPFLVPAVVKSATSLFGAVTLENPHTLIWTVSAWAFLPASLFMRGIAMGRIAMLITEKRKLSKEDEGSSGLLPV